jgi:hypothetical protein
VDKSEITLVTFQEKCLNRLVLIIMGALSDSRLSAGIILYIFPGRVMSRGDAFPDQRFTIGGHSNRF